jgi:ectoine hydroxylase
MTTTILEDRHPSRTGGGSEITERHDPVRWGDDPGPLTASQLADYERDGFLVVPDLLGSDAVEACLAAARELSRSEDGPGLVAEPDADDELRSVFELDRHPAFASLIAMDALAGAARQLLGSDVYIHQSRLNLKRAFTGRGFPWHSDFETWHVEDGMPAMRAVSCSVALTDNLATNGPLLLISGSHRWFVSCPGQTPEDHHLQSLRRQEYGVPDHDSLGWLAERGDVRAFTGKAGSVVFFECNTMHGSADNITPTPRTSAFFVYNSIENQLVEPFGADQPRPTHLAARGDVRPVAS